MADAGHLHARLQRHHELERSGRWESRARRHPSDDAATVTIGVRRAGPSGPAGFVGPAILAVMALVSLTRAQVAYDVKANYVKREVFIPMRDGVKLFTIIYSPKSTAEKYPMLMTRTAYGI